MNNLRKLYLYNFLSSLHIFGGVLMPFFMQWGGLNMTQVMLLQSVFTLGIFLFEVPTGVVADIYGRRISLILGSLVGVLGFSLYVSSPRFGLFVLGELIVAVAFTLRSGANEALLYESLPCKSEAHQAFAKLGTIAMTGVMLGPLLGSMLVEWFTPRQVFSSQILVLVIATVLAWQLTERSKPKSSESTRFWTTLVEGTRLVFSQPKLLLFALDMSIVAGLSKMMIFLFQAHLLQQGVANVWLGRLQSGAVAIEIVAIQVYAWTAARQNNGSNQVIFWSGLIPALGFWLLGHSLVLTTIGVLITIGLGLSRKPFFKTMFNHEFNDNQRATALSAVSMLSGLFLAVVNPLVGYFADIDLLATSRTLGVILATSVLLSWWLRRVERGSS